MPVRHAQATSLVVLALAAIALATLTPLPGQAPQSAATPFVCLPCGEEGTTDFLLNVLLFAPLGLGLALGGVPWRWALPAMVFLTAGIEGLQYAVIPGRDSSLGDLVANGLGGGVGLALIRAGPALLRPEPALRRLLTLAAAVLPVLVAWLTAWLLAPSLPDTMWYGQWAPQVPSERWFEGRLLGVELGGEPLPRWQIEDSPDRHARLLQGPISLTARIVSGPPVPGTARIVSVADGRSRLLALSQRGAALRFTVRTRAADWRLRQPSFALRGALPSSGRTTEVGGIRETGAATVFVRGRSEIRRREPLNVALGWTLLLPVDLDGSVRALGLSLLWLGAWFVPLGYYAARGRGRAPLLLLGAAGSALWLVPRLFLWAPTSPAIWLAAAAGLAVGAGLGRLKPAHYTKPPPQET